MKNRKIFLEGYIELKPTMFKSGRWDKSFASIASSQNYVTFSDNALAKAKVCVEADGEINAMVYISPAQKEFAIVFDKEGEFIGKRYKTSNVRFHSVGLSKAICECGFERGKRYKASSPAEQVIVVTAEEL